MATVNAEVAVYVTDFTISRGLTQCPVASLYHLCAIYNIGYCLKNRPGVSGATGILYSG